MYYTTVPPPPPPRVSGITWKKVRNFNKNDGARHVASLPAQPYPELHTGAGSSRRLRGPPPLSWGHFLIPFPAPHTQHPSLPHHSKHLHVLMCHAHVHHSHTLFPTISHSFPPRTRHHQHTHTASTRNFHPTARTPHIPLIPLIMAYHPPTPGLGNWHAFPPRLPPSHRTPHSPTHPIPPPPTPPSPTFPIPHPPPVPTHLYHSSWRHTHQSHTTTPTRSAGWYPP